MRYFKTYSVLVKFFKKEFNKKLIVFFIFFLIALLLWFVNALDKKYTETLIVPIEITEIPKTKALLNEIPTQIKVELKATGFSILRYYIKYRNDTIRIPIGKLCETYGKDLQIIKLVTKTNSKILEVFNDSYVITKINPDTIVFRFANVSQKKVAVKPNVNIVFTQQYQLQNTVLVEPDSIIIYGAEQILKSIDSVQTVLVSKSKISQSFKENVSLQKIANVHFNIQNVTIVANIEKFTEQQYSIPITPINVPDSLIIDLMKHEVLITMFIGINKSTITDSSFKVIADYSKENKLTGEIPIEIVKKPLSGKIVKCVPETVGYIIDLK